MENYLVRIFNTNTTVLMFFSHCFELVLTPLIPLPERPVILENFHDVYDARFSHTDFKYRTKWSRRKQKTNEKQRCQVFWNNNRIQSIKSLLLQNLFMERSNYVNSYTETLLNYI